MEVGGESRDGDDGVPDDSANRTLTISVRVGIVACGIGATFGPGVSGPVFDNQAAFGIPPNGLLSAVPKSMTHIGDFVVSREEVKIIVTKVGIGSTGGIETSGMFNRGDTLGLRNGFDVMVALFPTSRTPRT